MTVDANAGPRGAQLSAPNVSTVVSAAIRAGLVALVANIVIHTVAAVLGVTFVLTPPGGQPVEINVASVSLMSVVPIVVGGLLLALLARYAAGAARSLSWVGLLIGVGTTLMPISMDGDLSTRLVLASMHVVTGLAWFVSLRRAGL